MTMFDVVIEGGMVVTADGRFSATVAIRGGVIAALLAPGAPHQARTRVDARGRLVMPGMVDAHVHFREPGNAHKEGFRNGSQAAAAGGVTTVMIMPTDVPVTLTVADFEQKRAMGEGNVFVDFALQAAVGQNTRHVEALAERGAISFEIFLADQMPSLRLEDGASIIAALQAVARTGRLVGVVPGETSIVETRMAEAKATGTSSIASYVRCRPPVAEAMSVARAAAAAAEFGCPVLFRQISCRAAVDVLRDARVRSPHVLGETNPHYLTLTQERITELGPFAIMAPPLRQGDDVEALWQALDDETLAIVTTDHAPHLPEEKEVGRYDIWKAPLGVPGLQTMLPLLLERAWRGACTYCDIVRWCSERPARLFGLHPRKGTLQPGADADIVIVDPSSAWTITDSAQVSRAVRTPFVGMEVHGVVERVLLRGSIIFAEGNITGQPLGRFVAP